MAEERSETRIMESPPAGATAEGGPPSPPPPSSPPIGSDRAPLAATAEPSAPPRDAFAPPSTRRRLAASRGTLPTVIVFSVIAADAAALVIYFIAR
jgi:hypothetical protein